jgi:putative phage-type endonuclease
MSMQQHEFHDAPPIVEQGSPEWRALRLGKVTASRITDVCARIKNGSWGASRKNYAAELIVERLTGKPGEGFKSPAMQWGSDCEPEARAAYEFFRNAEIEPASFVDHPEIDMAGASPDGFVGLDGLVEFKCPNTATHLSTLLTGEMPPEYMAQVQFQMACTGRHWVDWCSFDPRLPPQMQLIVIRIERDEVEIARVAEIVREFLNEIDDGVIELRERFPGAAQGEGF